MAFPFFKLEKTLLPQEIDVLKKKWALRFAVVLLGKRHNP